MFRNFLQHKTDSYWEKKWVDEKMKNGLKQQEMQNYFEALDIVDEHVFK